MICKRRNIKKYVNFKLIFPVLIVCLFQNNSNGQNMSEFTPSGIDTGGVITPFPALTLIPMLVDTNLFSQSLSHLYLDVKLEPKLSMKHFYDPKNVFPEKSYLLDYRRSSYYTPRIVQDRMDFIMNRPRADSFVPIPVVAVLAANLALKYMDIEKKLSISAMDYMLEKPYLLIMKALWKTSPLTLTELYAQKTFRTDLTVKRLEEELEILMDKGLVKRREMEKGETQYFPSQKKEDVIELLNEKLLDSSLTEKQRTIIANLLSDLKAK